MSTIAEPLPSPGTVTERAALMPITVRPDVAMVRGEGAWLFDERGRRYLDFVQGWAVNALGHCPPELAEALARQAGRLVSPSPAYHNAPQFELAELLCSTSGLARVHFANSGAEANEAAVKLARKWGQAHRGGAWRVITTQGGFHGRTLAMMAASGKPGWDRLFAPAVDGFDKVPFGDADAVEVAITAETVAIMVEPIQGEAGVIVPPDGYLAALREIADRHGVLLVLDEVQTGMGRTGHAYAFQHEGVTPDIMTLGKGLGGGVPISAMAAAESVCCFVPGDQGGTFNGNPLMTAAALAVSQVTLDGTLLADVQVRGSQLMTGLSVLPGVADTRGRGLLVAARLEEPVAAEVASAAFELGLLVNAPRPDTLRFMPSLRTSAEEVEQCLALLADALAACGAGSATLEPEGVA